MKLQTKIWSLFSILVLNILFIPSVAYGQAGAVIRGRIIDAETADPVFGANVIVRAQNSFSQTDFDGKYSLNVAPGEHTVEVQMIGYDNVIRKITVKPGDSASLNITLGVQLLDAVEVEGRALNNTEASMLSLQRKAATVSDGISAEAIKKSPDSNAGDVLKRVTGITLIGGKYVFVRGLGERYSNTELNGHVLPSPEPDKRVVPMDLFPASLIKNIRVIKGFVPENSAEFSGGLVQVETVDYPDELILTVGIGVGGNYNTTQHHFKTVDGGGNDYLGLYNDPLGLGTKKYDKPELIDTLPNFMPLQTGSLGRGLSEEAVKSQSLGLSNNWDPKTINAPFDRKFNVSIGNSIDLSDLNEGMRFGYIYGTAYSRSFQYTEVNEARYDAVNPDAKFVNDQFLFPEYTHLTKIRTMDSDNYEENVLWGHNLNLALDITNGQQIYAKTFYSIQSDKYVKEGTGWRDYQNEDLYYQLNGFISRQIFSEVVGGKHSIQYAETIAPHLFEWSVNYSEANRYAPDQKVQTWTRPHGDTLEKAGKLYRRYFGGQDGVRYWSENEDTTRAIKASYELPFSQWDGLKSKLKFGGESLDRQKYFSFTRLKYEPTGDDLTELNSFPVGGNYTFHPARTWQEGNQFEEDNPGNPAFDAGQKIHAYFVQVDMPLLEKLRFVGGARQERSYQYNYTYDPEREWDARKAPQYRCGNIPKDFYYSAYVDAGLCPEIAPGFSEIETDDVLPALNLVYELNKDMNVRGGYSETIARPDLREISEFQFQAFYLDDVYTGNSNLSRSYIHNYDLRWEWYITGLDYIGVGFFHKYISAPIEVIGQPYSDDKIAYTYYNGKWAKIDGIEFEYRRDFLTYFRAETNIFLIKSQVEIMDWTKRAMIENGSLTGEEATLQPTTINRQLQGQSPYVVNLKLFAYLDEDRKHEFGIYYNVFGDRIAFVGTNGSPDVYEKSTGVWDLVYKGQVEENLDVKVSLKNVTDARYKQVQKSELLNEEYLFKSYRKGVDYSASLSYKF